MDFVVVSSWNCCSNWLIGVVGLGGPFAFHHFGVNVIVCTYVDHVEFGMLIYGRIRVANSLEWKKVFIAKMAQ